jgi:hypothetical protein
MHWCLQHPMQGFTHSMFAWATLVTSSHMWTVEIAEPQVRLIGLLPMIDMIRLHFNV